MSKQVAVGLFGAVYVIGLLALSKWVGPPTWGVLFGWVFPGAFVVLYLVATILQRALA